MDASIRICLSQTPSFGAGNYVQTEPETKKRTRHSSCLDGGFSIVWECSIRDKNADEIADVINSLEEWIKNGTTKSIEIGIIGTK
ncbi:hypothetical protein MASR2M48_34030 [Spirochaetota bacterium]